MKVWCFTPQSGGTKISQNDQQMLLLRAKAHAARSSWYPRFQLHLRFKGQFCYLDASEEGKEAFPIGRLRYFSSDRFSLAFYTYSNEKYSPCLFSNGENFGTLEQAIDICAAYLIE